MATCPPTPWFHSICVLAAAATMLLSSHTAMTAAKTPLPRPRPWIEDRALTACADRMVGLADFQQLPPIKGPGQCEADDVIRLVAIWSPDATRVKRISVIPPAVLRCGMAEALAHWVREASDVARVETGSVVAAVSTSTSFACRGRNNDPNAKLSEHAFANAVDLRALILTNGKTLTLTDPMAPMTVRTKLQLSACRRFTTVLGPGSDGYHEDHVHLDLLERRRGYRICQWDVRVHSDD